MTKRTTREPASQQIAVIDDIESLISTYYPAIRRLALSILDDPFDADDAAQETFISAYRNLSRYRGEASIKTWLSAITVNICRGKLRKRKALHTLQAALQGLFQIPSDALPEHAALQREVDDQVWQAVNTLDEKHRLVVILRYVHEMSAPEIGFTLGISEGTVYSRLYHARRKLQIELDYPQVEVYDGSP